MKSSNEIIEILNDLVQINNDRITGYEKALKELKEEDEDLQPLFMEFIAQSHELKNKLGMEVQVLGGDIDTSTTTRGKIYRAWMDVKTVFTGQDRHGILANCEYGEDAAQKAYNEALNEDIPAHLREMIAEQKKELRNSHDEVKAFRDAVIQ